MAIDISGLKRKADLGQIVEKYLGASASRRSRWQWWRCPWHNDRTPSFGVTSDNGKFKCYGCGAAGDVFEFVRRMEGLAENPHDFIVVARRVADLVGAGALAARPVQTARVTVANIPSERWQEQARRVVRQAADNLWKPVGAGARRYLMEIRGLTERTLRGWKLGWWPWTSYEESGLWGMTERTRDIWLPRGVVIPGEVAGVMWYVKFRPAKSVRFKAKYYGLPGGRTALLGADRWTPGLDLLLCEGEPDFLTAWQELREMVNVATLGGVAKARRGKTMDFGRWAGAMLRFGKIYMAYDDDEAGRLAAAAMVDFSDRAACVGVPHGGDLNGFHTRGGSLSAWFGLIGGAA